jgi:threonine dehydrogenase-like Zn-dependent dehydrogenase
MGAFVTRDIGGRVDPARMTTHSFDFERIGKAFDPMRTKEDGVIKPLVRFC